jgi:hypothetical protein
MRDAEHLRQLLDERSNALRRELEALAARLDSAFAAAEKATAAALDSAKEAVTKAESASDRRFESVNEFRATLQDQTSQFVSRLEFSAKVDALDSRIRDMARIQEQASGKDDGVSATKSGLIAGIGLLVAIVVAGVAVLAALG